MDRVDGLVCIVDGQDIFVCATATDAESDLEAIDVDQGTYSGYDAAGGGSTRPLASTIGFGAGRTRANNAIVTLGVSGDVSIYSTQATGETAHVIVDVTGYFR